MKVLEKAQTIRTTDVVVIHDEEKNIKWFLAMERTNGRVDYKNGCVFREMMNPDYFNSMDAKYKQKIYDLSYNEIMK